MPPTAIDLDGRLDRATGSDLIFALPDLGLIAVIPSDERGNFFDGRFLTAEDLRADQQISGLGRTIQQLPTAGAPIVVLGHDSGALSVSGLTLLEAR